MRKIRFPWLILLILFTVSPALFAQQPADETVPGKTTQVPIDTQMTLDAASPVQQAPIHSVLLMQNTKRGKKGTGFLLSSGVVITAAHVVCGCSASDVTGVTTMNELIQFAKLERDEDRDIAALVPKKHLSGGLELAPGTGPRVGQQVNTWGFPLIYNGPAPLLSVGYVSGLYEAAEKNSCDPNAEPKGLRFKHIVVNGAFNPGNSGGPLFVLGQNKVVSLVIWKSIAFSDQVKHVINVLHNPRTTAWGNFTETLSDGTTRGLSDQEAMARVLDEFYTTVQVDIGEAVSASEIRAFLNSHAADLSPRE